MDNYQHTEGEPKVKLEMTNWIDVLPKVLILQLNRTAYCKNEGMIKKLHEIQIPKKLNPARFLYKNKVRVELKRFELHRLR